VNRIALVPHDIVDIPHPHAPEARCSTPQVLDEVRDRLKERVLARRERVEELFKWFDKNNKKVIAYGAFRDQIRQLKLPLQDHHIKELWIKCGAGKKGEMNLKDFSERLLDFDLSGRPIASSQLEGHPEGAKLPDQIPRNQMALDLDRPRTTTSGGRRRPASPSIQPFGSRPRSSQGRGATQPLLSRPGSGVQRGAAPPRAPSQVDIFAQASDELRRKQGRRTQRQDHSFRGDASARLSRPGTGNSAFGYASGNQASYWESSKSIK